MSILLSLLLGVVVVLLITAATGYFVAQEFAYMAVDRSQLAARAAQGDAAATRALRVTRRTSFMLSGAQLGITVTALLVGYVAEPLIGSSIGELFGLAGVPTGVGVAIGTVLALAFSTLVQMLFGELFPKNLAIARPEPVARWLGRSTLIYLRIWGWLIWVFDQSSNLLLRLLKIEPVHDVEHSASTRDLQHIVADSREAGELPEELSLLLDRVLDFPEEDVEHAMVPRHRVDTVPATATVADVRALMAGGHSRYPVLDDGESILGTVHLVDVLAWAADGRSLEAGVGEVVRPAVVVPTLMSLPDALVEMARARDQLACVVDEYGGFAGIVTVEDLVEEVVGEITDEHDEPEEPLVVPDENGDADPTSWTVRGESPVDEVERQLGIELPEGDYETLAGLAIAVRGALPEVGDHLEIELPLDAGDLAGDDEPPVRILLLEVLEVESHVPSVVRARLEQRTPDEHLARTAVERSAPQEERA